MKKNYIFFIFMLHNKLMTNQLLSEFKNKYDFRIFYKRHILYFKKNINALI